MKKTVVLIISIFCFFAGSAYGASAAFKNDIYNPGKLKPVDSVLKVKAGQKAPDFTLKAVSGKMISLRDFYGKKNVVISFVPAAWTPVCSDQWPGYNIIQDVFESNEAVLLGITVDNIPTLFSWTNQMGKLWFEVLSDFWPHGAVAEKFGLLRSDGMTERALLIIDKKGLIRYIKAYDINRRPPLEDIVRGLEGIK